MKSEKKLGWVTFFFDRNADSDSKADIELMMAGQSEHMEEGS